MSRTKQEKKESPALPIMDLGPEVEGVMDAMLLGNLAAGVDIKPALEHSQKHSITSVIVVGSGAAVVTDRTMVKVVKPGVSAVDLIGVGHAKCAQISRALDARDTGAELIIAGTGGGKTQIANSFARADAEKGLKVASISMSEAEKPLYGSQLQLFIAMHLAATAEFDVLYVDSLRSVFNELGGNLKKQGVSRRVDGLLTSIDQFARKTGLRVVLTLNPSDDEREKEAVMGVFKTASASLAVSRRVKNFTVVGDTFMAETEVHIRATRSNSMQRVSGKLEGIDARSGISDTGGVFNAFLISAKSNPDFLGPDYPLSNQVEAEASLEEGMDK